MTTATTKLVFQRQRFISTPAHKARDCERYATADGRYEILLRRKAFEIAVEPRRRCLVMLHDGPLVSKLAETSSVAAAIRLCQRHAAGGGL